MGNNSNNNNKKLKNKEMLRDTKNSPITGGHTLADHRTSHFLYPVGHEQNQEWKLNGSLMNMLGFEAEY